jgi:apolipoprotein N-acyltransferase
LICYEDVFPQLARLSTIGGAMCWWWSRTTAGSARAAPPNQHAAHSVLRAVETRRPVLRVRPTLGGVGWIDEFGNVRPRRQKTRKDTIYFRGTKTIEVSRECDGWIENSFYTEYGDWFCAGVRDLVTFGLPVKITEGPAPRRSPNRRPSGCVTLRQTVRNRG